MEATSSDFNSATICVRLLGPLEVSRRLPNGSWQAIERQAWGVGTPPRSVFKRLLTTPGRRLARTDIQEDLWPDMGMELADHHLSNALTTIRRVIGRDLLETIGSLCTLAEQAQIWVDLTACTMLLKAAENQGGTTPAALPFLEVACGYFERGTCLEDEGATWCHAVRADAERMERQCRLWLAEGYEHVGKLWQAGEQYRALTRPIPPDEEALQRWMQMLTRHGKMQEAVKCYQSVKAWWETRGFATSKELEQIVASLEKRPSFHLFLRGSGIAQPPSNQLSIAATRITEMFYTISDSLDQAEQVINAAWEAWFASKPNQATREVTRLLPTLERVFSLPLASIHILRAKELAARCHGLLGAIYIDALQNDAALYHHTQAHTLAEEIHDVNLAATYLALIGDVLRRQNDKATAVRYMEYARDQAVKADQATLGHILQLLAYTYADTGNEAAFEQTISEATNLLAFTGEGRDSAEKEFIPFEIYEIQGKANRDLGKPLKAIPYLELAEKSLKQAEAVTPRWHALLEISRGQAFCDAGDLVIGVDLASRGFTQAYQCRSPRQMNRVRKLLRKLENSPWRHERKVSELKELIHETYLHMDLEK